MSFSKNKITSFWRQPKSICSSFPFIKKNKRIRSQEDLDKKLVYSLSPKKIPDGKQLKHLGKFLRPKETLLIRICLLVFVIALSFLVYSFFDRKIIKLPRAGGVYTEALVGYPKNINPLYASSREVDSDISRLIYSSLFRYNKDGNLEKDLIDFFEIKEEGKEYLIKIKENVSWHDEGFLTADDVVFTFNLIKDESFRSPLKAHFEQVEVERIDDHFLKFILKEAYAPFPSLLTFGILPKYLWENSNPDSIVLSDLNLKPIGSGPFKFKSIFKTKSGEIREYLLEANKEYYNKAPYLKAVKFIFYPDRLEAIKAINDKQVLGLSSIPLSQRNNLLAKNSLHIRDLVQAQIISLFLNPEKVESLKDKETRQVLASAINKEEIISDIFADSYSVANGPCLEKRSKLDDEAMTAFSNERAKEFFSDKELKLQVTVVDVANNVAVVEKIKKQLELVAVEVEIKAVSGEQILDIIKNREFEVLLYGQAIGGDADIYSFWHSSQISNSLNLAAYKNDKVNQLLTEARVELDEEKRKSKYQEVYEIITDDVPAIFLYSPAYSYVQTKDVHGFSGDTLIEASDRFNDINNWYIKVKRKIVW